MSLYIQLFFVFRTFLLYIWTKIYPFLSNIIVTCIPFHISDYHSYFTSIRFRYTPHVCLTSKINIHRDHFIALGKTNTKYKEREQKKIYEHQQETSVLNSSISDIYISILANFFFLFMFGSQLRPIIMFFMDFVYKKSLYTDQDKFYPQEIIRFIDIRLHY